MEGSGGGWVGGGGAGLVTSASLQSTTTHRTQQAEGPRDSTTCRAEADEAHP